MSSHTASISLGRTGTASGGLKSADVVGHLYVGGSGTWHFHRLGQGDDRSLSMQSSGYGTLWQEVAAAFAVLLHHKPGLEAVAEGLPALGIRVDAERIEAAQVSDLARLVGDVEVAAALAVFDGHMPEELADLSDVPGWSVKVAAPAFERVHSRWGTEDTRAL